MQFDRQKYLDLAKTQGVSAALTQLQKDTIEGEYEAFEGEKGWQPAMWQELEEVRSFSRELWEAALNSA
ncbi:MAG: hypothetical protein P4M08_06240 [Oligoflexia bacterium]|nr:hypothetical protein [Oligoflexia bacterium]